MKTIDRDLFAFMDAFNNEDEPDGAWWAILEDSVRMFNTTNHTTFEPFESVHAYLQAKEVKND